MSISGKDAELPTPEGPDDIIYALGTADEWLAQFSAVTVRGNIFSSGPQCDVSGHSLPSTGRVPCINLAPDGRPLVAEPFVSSRLGGWISEALFAPAPCVTPVQQPRERRTVMQVANPCR